MNCILLSNKYPVEKPYEIERKIDYKGTVAIVEEKWVNNINNFPSVKKEKKIFTSFHMASAGYWQRSDDE